LVLIFSLTFCKFQCISVGAVVSNPVYSISYLAKGLVFSLTQKWHASLWSRIYLISGRDQRVLGESERACFVFLFCKCANRRSLCGAQRGCSFKSALCVIRRGWERAAHYVCWWRALIFDEAAECCVSHRFRDLLLIAPQRRDRNLCKKLALILLAGAVLGQMAANCRFMVILGPTYRRTLLGLVNFDLMRGETREQSGCTRAPKF
jgi:hypothetical protein